MPCNPGDPLTVTLNIRHWLIAMVTRQRADRQTGRGSVPFLVSYYRILPSHSSPSLSFLYSPCLLPSVSLYPFLPCLLILFCLSLFVSCPITHTFFLRPCFLSPYLLPLQVPQLHWPISSTRGQADIRLVEREPGLGTEDDCAHVGVVPCSANQWARRRLSDKLHKEIYTFMNKSINFICEIHQ